MTALSVWARLPCWAQSSQNDGLCSDISDKSDQVSLIDSAPFIVKFCMCAGIAHACGCRTISGNINKNIAETMVWAVHKAEICWWLYSKLSTNSLVRWNVMFDVRLIERRVPSRFGCFPSSKKFFFPWNRRDIEKKKLSASLSGNTTASGCTP